MFRTTAEAKGEVLDPEKNMFKPSGNLLLTVPMRYFCCGPPMLHVVMSVCVWSSAIWLPELQQSNMLPVLSVL